MGIIRPRPDGGLKNTKEKIGITRPHRNGEVKKQPNL